VGGYRTTGRRRFLNILPLSPLRTHKASKQKSLQAKESYVTSRLEAKPAGTCWVLS